MNPLLQLGEMAPGFEAEASDGKRYTLAGMLARSNVALIFYPGNDTPG